MATLVPHIFSIVVESKTDFKPFFRTGPLASGEWYLEMNGQHLDSNLKFSTFGFDRHAFATPELAAEWAQSYFTKWER